MDPATQEPASADAPERALGVPVGEREQADALADRLLLAHRRLREVDLPPDDKARAHRRLIALTDASKHDVGRAAARLDAFLADLDAGRVAAED